MSEHKLEPEFIPQHERSEYCGINENKLELKFIQSAVFAYKTVKNMHKFTKIHYYVAKIVKMM